MDVHRAALWLGLLFSVAATAQSPLPAERYADPDPAAQFVEPLDLRDRRAVSELERLLRRDPDNVPARVQMARLLLDRGQRNRAAAEFERALGSAASEPLLSRYVNWNYGWALFESAEPAGALRQWQRAAEAHGGQPYWLPLVHALVAWTHGDRDGAVAHYAVAAASEPARWGSLQALQREIAGWPPNARFTLETVQQAWQP